MKLTFEPHVVGTLSWHNKISGKITPPNSQSSWWSSQLCLLGTVQYGFTRQSFHCSLICFQLLFFQAHSSPSEDPDISAEERKLILGGSALKEPVSVIPWKLILSKPPVWALIISHFCHNWGTFILLTWMPTYYNQVNGIMNWDVLIQRSSVILKRSIRRWEMAAKLWCFIHSLSLEAYWN